MQKRNTFLLHCLFRLLLHCLFVVHQWSILIILLMCACVKKRQLCDRPAALQTRRPTGSLLIQLFIINVLAESWPDLRSLESERFSEHDILNTLGLLFNVESKWRYLLTTFWTLSMYFYSLSGCRYKTHYRGPCLLTLTWV